MDMRMLAAAVAKIADQRRAAIQAITFMGMAVGTGFARPRLDRPTQEAARDRIANCFEFAHRVPLATLIIRGGGAGRGGMLANSTICSASAYSAGASIRLIAPIVG